MKKRRDIAAIRELLAQVERDHAADIAKARAAGKLLAKFIRDLSKEPPPEYSASEKAEVIDALRHFEIGN